MQHSRPKVFFIGFNKTATTSFHKFFESNGYKSFHHSKVLDNEKKYLGNTIRQNLEKNIKLLHTIDAQDVYSDFCFCKNNVYFEANEHFNLLDVQYPNSYFVLQIRNENDWIKSRFNHRPKGLEYFYIRTMNALNINETKLEVFWRKQRKKLHKKIIKYFKDSRRFLIFDIDHDKIHKLTGFLQRSYTLDSRYWKYYNVSG